MFGVILAVLRSLGATLQPRRQLLLENLALRHQLLVLNRTAGKPRFGNADRLLWVILRAVWSRWEKVLVIIRPQTVIGWHRAGFRLYWRWKSRGGGRSPIDRELIRLIRRMWQANPTAVHGFRLNWQTGSPCLRRDGSQASPEGQSPAAIADVASVPSQSRDPADRHRFLHGADGYLSRVVRLCAARA